MLFQELRDAVVPVCPCPGPSHMALTTSDLGTLLNQKPDDLLTAGPGGPDQRGQIGAIAIDVGSSLDERADGLEVAVGRGIG